jgi:hypothetical protein
LDWTLGAVETSASDVCKEGAHTQREGGAWRERYIESEQRRERTKRIREKRGKRLP